MRNTDLTDRYQRHLNYLRVSITDRCNLQCVYCVPGVPFPKLKHEEVLSYEEILRIIGVGIGLGITKVRVTGGEPLVRKGVCDFLGRLTALDGLRDVSLTTNGVLLERHVDAIRAAGIRRINVSLDSLDPEKYAQITRRDRFRKVWNGIMAAFRAGFDPIKINVVALGGINDDELIDLARLTFDYPFHVRFIEYMPIGDVGADPGRQILGDDILARMGELGHLIPVERQRLDGPAERYRLEGARGEIGIIGAISHHFCSQCNRLRLTASGRLRTCLLSDESIDFRDPIRSGCSDRDVAALFIEAARRKQQRHHLDARTAAENRGPHVVHRRLIGYSLIGYSLRAGAPSHESTI